MATFAALTTRVVNKYKGSSGATFTTQAEDAINDAIEFFQNEQFWFSEGTEDVTLTEDDPEITTATGFPSDFWYLHPDGGLAIVQSNRRFLVEKRSVSEYDKENSEGTGRPRIYRELGNTIQVYPYPNDAYTLEVRYIKKYVALSGSQTNDFTVYAPQLIEARALSMLFLGQGHDGEKMHKFWENKEQQYLGALRSTTQKRVGTGNLALND